MSESGVPGIPGMMLGYTGMAFLILVWVVAWIAWGWMVYSRYRRHHAQQPPNAG